MAITAADRLNIVRLAIAAFSPLAPVLCSKHSVGSLSRTQAVALRALMGIADLAALNKDRLTGKTEQWSVDSSALIYLITTLAIHYGHKLKGKKREALLLVMGLGDFVHGFYYLNLLAPTPLPKMDYDKAWEWLGCPKGANFQVAFESYTSQQTGMKKRLSRQGISPHVRGQLEQTRQKIETAFCTICEITLKRAQAFATYFKNDDGSPLFDYPANGVLSEEQRKTLAVRYWELYKSSKEARQYRLEFHYIWITTTLPPTEDPSLSDSNIDID